MPLICMYVAGPRSVSCPSRRRPLALTNIVCAHSLTFDRCYAPPPPPQALSNIVWALATLDLHPGPELKAAVLSATGPDVLTEQFSPQGICNLLWGLGHLHPDLPGRWISGLAAATLPRLHSEFSPEQLCTLLYAASQLPGGFPTTGITATWLSRLQTLVIDSAPLATPQVYSHLFLWPSLPLPVFC